MGLNVAVREVLDAVIIQKKHCPTSNETWPYQNGQQKNVRNRATMEELRFDLIAIL